MAAKQNTLFVGALAKGLKVLRAFDDTASELSLSELATRCGLDKSATQRLANTLHLEGMLDKDPETRRFRPSHAWLEMAYAYSWSNPLISQAQPRLIDLSLKLGETINLAEQSGNHIIYVSRLPCRRTNFAASLVGRRIPALHTSAGRAMLATRSKSERAQAVAEWPLHAYTPHTTTDRAALLDAIELSAQQGYAVAREQMFQNEVGIAAPIYNSDGRAYAAVQCSVSAHLWDEAAILTEILPLLQDTANAITPGPRRFNAELS